MRYHIDDEQRDRWLQWVARKNLTKRPPRRFLDDALAYLRQNSRAWGVVPRGRFDVLLSYQREETFHKADTARVFVRENANSSARTLVDGSWTLDELTEHFKDDPARLMALVERELIWKKAREVCLMVLLGVALGCGVYLGGKVVVRWVRSLSLIEHVKPAPPRPLGGGVVIESAMRPSSEPERDIGTDATANETMLRWSRSGEVIAAVSPERLKYRRLAPDSDLEWTWTVTIDGVPHSYTTTAEAVRLLTPHPLKAVSFHASLTEIVGRQVDVTGDSNGNPRVVGKYALTDGETLTDGAVTAQAQGGPGFTLTAREILYLGREHWRAPFVRYACDGTLTCTFTLAPGPWHPCWQRVEVAFGDGTVVDTRSAPTSVLDAITWPRFLPPDERWFGYTDEWDRTRLRARHQYAKAGTYLLAYWITRADPRGYSGSCEPGPPTTQKERLRWLERDVEIAPHASGRYPPNAGM